MPVERRSILDREEWLRWRTQDVTASVVAALPRFACHPYVTPLRLFVEKSGVEFPDQDNAVKRRGRWLEPAIAEAVAEQRPAWKIEAPKVYLRDVDVRLAATPDYFLTGDPRGFGILQCKSVAPSVYEREWLDGTEPPAWVVLQTITEAMLAGAAFGAIAAMLVDPFNMEVPIIEVPRHPAVEGKIVSATVEFWADIAVGREPYPDLARDREVIEVLAPEEKKGKALDLSTSNELPILLAQRAALKARIKADETRCDEIENELRFMLGDAERGVGVPDWTISYKTTDYGGYTVAPRSSRVLRIYDRRPAEERPR